MARLPVILCLILPTVAMAEEGPQDPAAECDSCRARHQSLQALQAERTGAADGEAQTAHPAPGLIAPPGPPQQDKALTPVAGGGTD